MPAILAIETATSACSVAMRIEGEVVVREKTGSNIHSKVLLQEIDELLAQANAKISDLDAIAVGQGPGSFTGLRIGVGVAQGLAFGIAKPMIGVSSLAALAKQVRDEGRVLSVLDARMGEVYWQCFEQRDQELVALSEAQVSGPESLHSSDFHHLIGNAWREYEDQWPVVICDRLGELELRFPRAAEVLLISEAEYQAGRTVEAVKFQPVYVRNKVAKKKGE